MNTRWTTTTKLVVLISVLVVGAWLLVQFGQVIPPLVVAFILAFLIKPPTDGLVRRTGWPRGLAAAVVLLITLLLLGLAPVLITPSLATLVTRIRHEVAALAPILEQISGRTLHLGPLTIEGSDLAQRLVQGAQALITPAASGAVQLVSGIASSLFWLLFVIVTVFWLLKDSHKLRGWFVEHAPASYREELTELMKRFGLIWGGFFRGQLLVSLTVGVTIGVGLWVLGISNAFLLGIIAGLGEFVPTIGPVIALIPALLVAGFNGSSWLPLANVVVALLVLVFYTLVFQLDQVYVIPRFVGRRVQLHPGLVFVGSIIGAVQIGVLGVLLAAPVIASARLVGGYIYTKLLDLDPFPNESDEVVLISEPRGILRGQPVAGILFDLDGTLVDTDDAVVNSMALRLGRWRRLFRQNDPGPALRRLAMFAEGPANWFVTVLDDVGLDDEAFRLSQWIQRCLGHCQPEVMKLIPGVDAALHQLKSDYKLALVTTRGRDIAQYFLHSSGLDAVFDAVITRDDVRRLKPHPEPVLLAAQRLGLKAESCVMVGDTIVDIQAGQAAGSRTIGVLCGFGQRDDLADADLILESTRDVAGKL